MQYRLKVLRVRVSPVKALAWIGSACQFLSSPDRTGGASARWVAGDQVHGGGGLRPPGQHRHRHLPGRRPGQTVAETRLAAAVRRDRRERTHLYDWAWITITDTGEDPDGSRSLLVRRHRRTGDWPSAAATHLSGSSCRSWHALPGAGGPSRSRIRPSKGQTRLDEHQVRYYQRQSAQGGHEDHDLRLEY